MPNSTKRRVSRLSPSLSHPISKKLPARVSREVTSMRMVVETQWLTSSKALWWRKCMRRQHQCWTMRKALRTPHRLRAWLIWWCEEERNLRISVIKMRSGPRKTKIASRNKTG
jgi:hypothetical protein